MLKDITLTTQCFLFALFLLALLQQVFCKTPANQIIISTYSYLLYILILKLKEKNHTDNTLIKEFLFNSVCRLQKIKEPWVHS